ncbi:MAG TPA: hypothetical protein VNU46_02825, partial [Gemmatimonadaceae bacterium]|nr:hypothetical protein [Gemmatimonadaceae bacterium]
MDAHPTIARPAYFLAALLFFVPLFDAAMSMWPFHLGLEQWRFGAVGALSNYPLMPLAGLLLALVTARTNQHWRTRRILGWLCALFAVILLVIVLLFILDYYQTKSLVHPEYKHAMQVAMGIATVKILLTIVALTLLAPAGVTGTKSGRQDFPDPEKMSTPLI